MLNGQVLDGPTVHKNDLVCTSRATDPSFSDKPADGYRPTYKWVDFEQLFKGLLAAQISNSIC
jgi:hypothetical protein